jgi:hypothetical protein
MQRPEPESTNLKALPLDKVYGALGLLGEGNEADHDGSGLQVDYGKKMADVYTDLVSASCLRSGKLEFLAYAARYPNEDYSHTKEVPSWLPNWSQGFRDTGKVLGRAKIQQNSDWQSPYAVAGASKAECTFHPREWSTEGTGLQGRCHRPSH